MKVQMQVSNNHGHFHTHSLMLLNTPKTSRGRWAKGKFPRKRVPKTLGAGKESKQARTCLRVTGPLQEVHKGAPTMQQGGQQSCELGRGASTCGSCSRERPGQTSLVQCCKTGITVHKKKKWDARTKGQFQKNVCAWTVKKSCRGFPKEFYSCIRPYKGWNVVLCTFSYQFLEQCLLQHTVKSKTINSNNLLMIAIFQEHHIEKPV